MYPGRPKSIITSITVHRAKLNNENFISWHTGPPQIITLVISNQGVMGTSRTLSSIVLANFFGQGMGGTTHNQTWLHQERIAITSMGSLPRCFELIQVCCNIPLPFIQSSLQLSILFSFVINSGFYALSMCLLECKTFLKVSFYTSTSFSLQHYKSNIPPYSSGITLQHQFLSLTRSYFFFMYLLV